MMGRLMMSRLMLSEKQLARSEKQCNASARHPRAGGDPLRMSLNAWSDPRFRGDHGN